MTMCGTCIKWTLPQTELATNKSKVQTMCHLYSIQICSKQIPILWEFLKLNHPFRKTSTGQKGLSYIGLAIWNRLPNILKKIKYLNTFKSKMRHYYLNDLSNLNLSNAGGFDYTLAIIKNVFLFIKQIFLHLFFPASLSLKDYNENNAIHLFCVILATLFFFSLILLLASTFFICC